MRRTLVAAIAVLLFGALAGPSLAVADGNDGERVSTPECEFPLTVTDGTGTNVTLEEEPATVVTLNPSAAQTMWEIGADETVIGLTKHATNLEGAEDRTNISSESETIDPETVVGLEPDLVLAPKSRVVSDELIELLRGAGLTVYAYPSAESIDDVREKTRRTGELVGECEGAEETVEWMNREIEIVETAIEGEERPLVLYEFFGYTAGGDTFIHEIVETAGGRNLGAEVGIAEYQEVNEETVVDEDPDWLVLNTNSPEVPDGDAYASTTAIEEGQVIVVPVEYLNRPAPRIVNAITILAEAFHPDAYEEARDAAANASDEATDGSGPSDGGNATADADDATEDEAETGGDETSTDSNESMVDENTAAETPDGPAGADDVPGFGAPVALAALSLAALTAIRHRDGGG